MGTSVWPKEPAASAVQGYKQDEQDDEEYNEEEGDDLNPAGSGSAHHAPFHTLAGFLLAADAALNASHSSAVYSIPLMMVVGAAAALGWPTRTKSAPAPDPAPAAIPAPAPACAAPPAAAAHAPAPAAAAAYAAYAAIAAAIASCGAAPLPPVTTPTSAHT